MYIILGPTIIIISKPKDETKDKNRDFQNFNKKNYKKRISSKI